ncbi:MAG: hypothetical protein G01um10148_588 [Parcubacteria group bacterium Gr01-1014_8]|nr:MAG: hypothetical protein G01um10148_588 [Parcubacteria group bacterium Gr01-1014_8]
MKHRNTENIVPHKALESIIFTNPHVARSLLAIVSSQKTLNINDIAKESSISAKLLSDYFASRRLRTREEAIGHLQQALEKALAYFAGPRTARKNAPVDIHDSTQSAQPRKAPKNWYG